MSINQLKKEFLRFTIAGICAVVTDLIVYFILLKILPPNFAKGISFLLGTIIAYFINKFWTFEKMEKSIKEIIRFGVLYLSTLIVNVGVNEITLNLSNDKFIIAFLVATGFSAILNFVGQKWWVFK